MLTALDRVEAATWARFEPPPRLTLSEWADRYRVLPPESSAEPGRWRTSRVPYLREPMDVLSNRHVETVVLMASSQVGKTECLLNLLGYHMHLDPGPMLLIEPTLEMAGAVSKDRIAPMLRDTSVLRGLVSSPRSRDASNTMFHKTFRGGTLTLAGGNSPASLASRPIRLLMIDEADRIPASAGAEGDPVAIALKRTATFRRRKVMIVSSPTVKGASRIEDWHEISDQRRLHSPCPRCEKLFVLAWEHVRWTDHDPTTAYLECPECHGAIQDRERAAMIAGSRWIASKPFTGIVGFHIWEMFAPWRSLREQVVAFLLARHSLEMRQAWVNTSLGKVWETPGEKVEAGSLMLRREAYGDTLPAGVKLITMGVDVQDDRLEALVIGWGVGEESWVLERQPLVGDPGRSEVWRELDQLLDTAYTHQAGGALRILYTLVDAGGHKTQAVYMNVMPRQTRRVFPSFGRSGGEKGLLVSPPKTIRPSSGAGSIQRRIVDVDQVKSLLFARLRLTEPGPEYVHFPTTVGETFFDELTAEKLVTQRNKYGVPSKSWVQIKERNETLDCFVLALAALRVVAPTPAKFQAVAEKLEDQRAKDVAFPPSVTPQPAPAPPPAKPSWLGPRRGGWLGVRNR